VTTNRYFDAGDAAIRLRAGRWVEQFLGIGTLEGGRVVRYVVVTPEPSGTFAATRVEAHDEGGNEGIGLYDFPAFDPDEPYGEIHEFADAEAAIAHCLQAWGADPARFVGQGMAMQEYLDASTP